MKEYGNDVVCFQTYYKYVFTYFGIANDGTELRVNFGGISDDIYKYEVNAEDEIELKEIIEGEILSIKVDKRKNIIIDIL